MNKVGHDIVLLFLFRDEAVVVLPCVLVHADVEGASLANIDLLLFVVVVFLLLDLQVKLIWLSLVFVLAEEATSGQGLNLGCGLLPHEITVLLFIHLLENCVRHQVRWQVSQ